MGDAVATFPASVATFLICVEANQRSIFRIATAPRMEKCGVSFVRRCGSWSCSAARSARGATIEAQISASRKCSRAESVTAPPMVIARSLRLIADSVSIAEVATRMGHTTCLNLVSIPTSVLPATIRAVGSAARMRNSACSLVGRSQRVVAPSIRSGAEGASSPAGIAGAVASGSKVCVQRSIVPSTPLASLPNDAHALVWLDDTTTVAGLNATEGPCGPSPAVAAAAAALLLLLPPLRQQLLRSVANDRAASMIGR